ncbi:unnamed protein product [Brachionus calyciflorus]|uniref:Uncharacterized protein n=1 Tax=Brachionus calyciflorus TaxID=104777 RepID=A0A814PB20_9BILA|nr:unnamed protein product [Brachionus calyciflorus]
MKTEFDKKSVIRQRIQESLIHSTSHGIPSIITSDNWILKVFWIIFTLISTGFCAFSIIQNILNYYKYDVTTKIRFKYEVGSEFPSITVCNSNFFSSEKGYNFYLKSLDKKKLIENSLKEEDEFAHQLALKLNISEIKSLGDSLDKLIYETCLDNREFVMNNESFTYFFHLYFGNCYTFNPGHFENGTKAVPFKSYTTGFRAGLTMKLNTTDSLGLLNDAVVLIHEFQTSPNLADPLFIKPNLTTNIALKRTFSTQLPKPYSNCDSNTDDPKKFNSDLYKEIHDSSYKYSQKLCQDLCFHKLLIQNCSCYTYEDGRFMEGEPCLTESGSECNYDFSPYFVDMDFLNKICLPKCPLECNTKCFNKLITSTRKNKEFELIELKIYFEDNVITEIVENEVMDIFTLISNIGGTAGLFLGVSFLSFAEILAICIRVLLILNEGNKNNAQNTKSFIITS